MFLIKSAGQMVKTQKRQPRLELPFSRRRSALRAPCKNFGAPGTRRFCVCWGGKPYCTFYLYCTFTFSVTLYNLPALSQAWITMMCVPLDALIG